MSSNFTPQELREAIDGSDKAKAPLPNFGSKIPKEITPPNFLKQKVGGGGLDEKILQKAQKMVDDNRVDFRPMAEEFLADIETSLTALKKDLSQDSTDQKLFILNAAMQLKGHGGMFKYQLVSDMSDLFVRFLESIKTINQDAFEVINGFYSALRAVIFSQIRGDGGKDGAELLAELQSACDRYRSKNT